MHIGLPKQLLHNLPETCENQQETKNRVSETNLPKVEGYEMSGVNTVCHHHDDELEGGSDDVTPSQSTLMTQQSSRDQQVHFLHLVLLMITDK